MTTSLFSNYYPNDINQTNNTNKFNNFRLKNRCTRVQEWRTALAYQPNYLRILHGVYTETTIGRINPSFQPSRVGDPIYKGHILPSIP